MSDLRLPNLKNADFLISVKISLVQAESVDMAFLLSCNKLSYSGHKNRNLITERLTIPNKNTGNETLSKCIN